MANKTNTITTKVIIDSSNAQIQINKLNSTASDSTKDLSERIKAKNKEIEIQEKLSKETIKNLAKEVSALTGVVGKEKQLIVATKKLNKAREKAGKLSNRNVKQQNRLAKSFKGVGSEVSNMIPILGKFKLALLGTGIGAIVVAAGALVALFVEAGKTGAKFQKSLSTLKGVAGATAKEIEFLADHAKRLGSSTAFTASSVVELQTELAKLAFDVREIGDATPAILDLAASLDVELADAASLTGGVIRAFGADASETTRYVDIMAKSTTSSALDFTKLRESMKYVAPVSKSLGIGVQETTTYLGVLADGMISGSMAGTGLAKTMIMLNQKGLTMDEAMEKVSGSTNKLKTAIGLVGIVGGKSLLTLSERRKDIEKLNMKLSDTADGAQDAAKLLAEIKLDNLSGDVTKLGSAWEGLMLSFEDGNGIINKLSRLFIQTLTGALGRFQTALELTSFIWSDFTAGLKNFALAGVKLLSGALRGMVGNFELFANKVKLVLSDIPILGSGIDANKAQKGIDDARDLMSRGARQIGDALLLIQQEYDNRSDLMKRFRNDQEVKLEQKLVEDLAKVQAEGQTKQDEVDAKKAEKAAEDRIAKEEKDRADRARDWDLKKAQEEENRLIDIEAQFEIDEMDIEARRLRGENVLALELALLERKRLQDVSNEDLTAKQVELINKKSWKAKTDIMKIESKTEKQMAKESLKNTVDEAAEMFGVAQELATARAIMNAPEAIGNVWVGASKQANPIMMALHGALGTAMVIAPIVKGLSDIKKVHFSGGKGKRKGGGGGGSISSGGGGGGASAVDIVSDISANNSSRLGIDPSLGQGAEASANNRVSGGASSSVVFSESRYADFQAQVGFREDRTTI